MILAPTLTLSAGSGAAIVRPTFSRDFAGEKTLNNGTGPAITFTRASNATFFDASGVLQTASNDQPRFDHDPATGNASRGLLIEESRTNSIRNSQAGGSTSGVIGSGGVMPTNWAAGAGGSSNGISTEIIGTGTENGLAYIDLKISGTPTASSVAGFNLETTTQVVAANGQTWTHSLFAKLVSGSLANATLRVGIDGRTAAGAAVSGQSTSTTFTATSASASTQRKSHTATFSDATVERILPSFQVVYTNANPIDLTLRIAAPQLEQGAFPTSYIPTTTAAATRSADSAVVTPISGFYNQSEGTLFAEASRPQVAKNVAFMAFTDGANANNVSAIETGVAVPTQQRFQVTSNGTAIAQLLYSAAGAANTVYKMIGTYAADDFIAAQNGVLTSADTSGTTPTTMTRLSIGLTTTDTNAGYSNSAVHIRKIAYYPRRLSNTLLQQLTT